MHLHDASSLQVWRPTPPARAHEKSWRSLLHVSSLGFGRAYDVLLEHIVHGCHARRIVMSHELRALVLPRVISF